MSEGLKPIALTMGDPAGVAGETTIKAWQKLRAGSDCFFLIGDPDHIRNTALSLNLACPVQPIGDPDQAMDCFNVALPVFPMKLAEIAEPGIGNCQNGKAITSSIETAVNFCKSGSALALVTNPINKAVLYDAGFEHPGHTEYLAELAGGGKISVMMLASEELKVVPLTLHVSLKDAVRQIDEQLLSTVISLVHLEMQNKFGLPNPRIAVSGLNPHAGEKGAMGKEEIEVIEPALRKLRNQGMDLTGPLPADTMFHAEARKTYDVAICMTHDQALIPIKTIAFDDAVNVTLGLPFVRTSPDHGTAFDIAGQGIAKPNSLIAAIKVASLLGTGARTQ